MNIQDLICYRGVCIPLRGNIPLRGGAVCILFISSGWVGIFLIEFCSSDPSFDGGVLGSLYLEFKTSAHAHIAIACYYALFTDFLT